MHQTLTEIESKTITTAAAWLSDVLDDLHHEASNTTRLIRLYQGTSLELAEFMATVRQAYSIIIPKLPALRKPMAYWFRILEDLLTPQVGLTARRAEAVAHAKA